jgi:hypothetical protein
LFSSMKNKGCRQSSRIKEKMMTWRDKLITCLPLFTLSNYASWESAVEDMEKSERSASNSVSGWIESCHPLFHSKESFLVSLFLGLFYSTVVFDSHYTWRWKRVARN